VEGERFGLYTSGATGAPKGVVGDIGGYLVALESSMSDNCDAPVLRPFRDGRGERLNCPGRATGAEQKSSRACENLRTRQNAMLKSVFSATFGLQQNAFDVMLGCCA
jgi:hypothetical protein